jgi:RNA polymerase sigma factor (sigma-70 family)
MPTRAAVVTRVVREAANPDLAALSDRDLLARFAADRDEAAFSAVVARHTAMVLGVCRRTLPRTVDPEDACQAVFLLLAQKARGGRWQASVAGWLYAAARKVARNARVAADRRVRRESRAAVPEAVVPTDAMSGRELVSALDEELDRLPPRYRDPLVLCYLEGLTRDEAAARLGVPEETLKSQLKRGRQRLADALTARGWEAGVVLLAAVATSASAVPRALHDAIRAAAAGSPSDAAAVLARRAAMTGTSVRTTITLLAAAGLAAVGLGLASALPPTPAAPPTGETRPAAEKAAEPDGVRIGASRFRAGGPIADARYGLAGKRVVGHAGSVLYVWDAADGSLLRTIATKLAVLEDPTRHRETGLAFAVHPTASRVACGGLRDGKTYLQVWDYETGKMVAETASRCDALKALAWTPDGTRLLERANVGWEKPTGWKLIVRDEKLAEVRSHDLPEKFGEYGTVMLPLPGGKEVILWQSRREPTVFDLTSGAVVRTIPFKASIPSDLAVSPDGKTLAVTSTEDMRLLNLSDGETRTNLPMLRSHWEKPRPLFSPDGATVIVWDHRPVAYDVASGKEKWKPTFRTTHTVRVRLCDVSPDGSVVLVRHGYALSRLDATTGAERDPPDAPTHPPGVVWSPDGRTLFTRAENHDRTWTAWDATSGRRLFDLMPTGFATDENWKMMPDLFFLGNGKEVLAGLEKSESTERVGPKELLVFDAATGRCLRRLGEPLPDETFRWTHPIALDPDGKTVLMQWFAVSAPPGPAGAPVAFDPNQAFEYATIRWDPVKQVKLQEWVVAGSGRHTPPRHYAPYTVTEMVTYHDLNPAGKRAGPAKIRCYSLTDGRLAHELQTEYPCVDLDRIQGNFLLTEGYDSTWFTRANSSRYIPQPPFIHDLWELPTRTKVRVAETNSRVPTILGPGGQFVVRVTGETTFEIHEPFVLKQAVTTVATPARPVGFEFSADGSRVAVTLTDASVIVRDTTPWRKLIGERLAGQVPADLAPLWEDLGKDAATGLRAARLLAAAGDRAVALLGEKIDAKTAPDAALIKRLIADLDAPLFATRQKAEKGLRDLAEAADAPLREELRANPPLEVRRRIEGLLRAIERRQLSAAEVREVRAVQALRWANTTVARELLAKWAKGDPSATLTRAAGQASGR